jgi:serine/threonine protein kinase
MATAKQWPEVQDLFHAALQREPRDRPVFLDKACGGNEAMRQEVAWLISAHETEDHFIDSPAYVAAGDVLAEGPDFEPGEKLAQFKIQTVLGEGGMGKVYLAEDTRLKRKVALKVLPAARSGDEAARKRLLHEAQAVAALDHPNICAIYETNEAADRSYIAMQYVEGETLESRMGKAPLSLDESLSIAMQVAEALCEAHAHGIIHRDIKPSNIMLNERGHIKVLDFGLAKPLSAALSLSTEDQTTRKLTNRRNDTWDCALHVAGTTSRSRGRWA